MNRLYARFLAGAMAGSVAAVSPALAARPTAAVPSVRASIRQPILDQDNRLDKRVTLRLKKSPLSVVVAALGQQVGVGLKAAPGVADEPTIAYATGQPAKEVMHQLALLFHYRWTRRGAAGQYTYEIYQDLNSQQEEEALRAQRRTLALRGLQSALSTRFALTRQSPQQLVREAAEQETALLPFEQLPKALRPFAALIPAAQVAEQAGRRAYQLREMADPFRRALLRVAAGLTAAQWNALAGGETLRFSTVQEPGTVTLPAVTAGDLRRAHPSLLPPGAHFGFASREDEARFRELEQQAAQAWGEAETLGVTVRLAMPTEAAGGQAVLTLTPAARMAAEHEGPVPPAPALVVVGDRLQSPDVAGAAEADAASTTHATWDPDPILGAERPFTVSLSAANGEEAEVGTLNHVLPQIAEAYDINLVADAYRAEPLPLPDLTTGATSPLAVANAKTRRLSEVLNLLVDPTARWRREGTFLQVRRRTWVHDRIAEIPERVAKSWAARFRQTPRFSLEDAASLVLTLRDEQLAQFEAVMQEQGIGVSLLFDTGAAEPARQQAMLRAYGSMLPLQRQTLRSGGAVPVAAMTPAARHWLRLALEARGQMGADGTAAGELDGVLALSGSASTARDEGDKPEVRAERGAEGRAAAGASPRSARDTTLHSVLFRYISQGNEVEAVAVTFPQVHRQPPAAQ